MSPPLPRDPRLPQLAALLDPRAMQSRFAVHLGPWVGAEVRAVEVEKVSYRVGRQLSVLYRVHLDRVASGRDWHWFAVRHVPGDQFPRRAEAARAAGASGQTPWPPFAAWQDVTALVWAFPHDPRLDQLAEVTDEGATAALLARHAAPLDLPRASADEVRCEPVKHMPSKRSVFRFEVGGGPPESRFRFYAKSFRDDRGARVFRSIEAMHRAAARRCQVLRVPRPLLHVPALRTYWQEAWPGPSLSGLHGTPELGDALPRVARCLAELHGLPVQGLGPATDAAIVAAEARSDAERLACYRPDRARRIELLAARITRTETQLPSAACFPCVPIHGAFRMSQLLDGGEQVAVIDFDGLGRGDPHYDVAEFEASLWIQAFRRGHPLAAAKGHAEAFRAAYLHDAPWPLDPHRLGWLRGAFLLEKAYLAQKNLEAPLRARFDGILTAAESCIDEAEAA